MAGGAVGLGQFAVSTSQGEPAKPVTLILPYDPGLVSKGSKPVVLYAITALHHWIPEATTVHANARTVTATLGSFSRLDVVDYLTWGVGTFVGDRADMPDGCTEDAPTWAKVPYFNYGRNSPLPACIVAPPARTPPPCT